MKKIIRGQRFHIVGELCMTAFLVLMICSSAFAAEPWKGAVGRVPDPVGNVYTITTPEQLAAVAHVMNRLTNILASSSISSTSPPSDEYIRLNSQYEKFRGKTFVLANDIDLNNCEWTPIGTMWFPFPGTFDGQGHSITGLKISTVSLYDGLSFNSYTVGLFGSVSGGDIKSLAVSGSVGVNIVDPSVSYLHIAGIAADVTDGDVVACVSNVKILFGSYEQPKYGADFAVGGVSASIDKENGTIFKCVHKGDITCTSEYEFVSVGGIVAKTQGNMDSCENTGNITVTMPKHNENSTCDAWVGGIVASATDNTILRCINRGNIEFDIASSYVGGIAGYFGNSSLIGCGNYGDITETRSSATFEGNYVGGIAGTSSYWDKGTGCDYVDWNDINIINACVNEGNITVSAGQCVGGITSSLYGRLEGSAVENCVNSGNVSNTYKNQDGWSRVGGIAGYSTEPVINCINLGDVYGNYYVGGIAGYILDTEVSNCTAICDVVATNNQYTWAGGIVATTFDSENAFVNDSVYCGQLVGKMRGAIVGEGVYDSKYSEESLTISDCAWVMTTGNSMEAFGADSNATGDNITKVINSTQVDKIEDAPCVSAYIKGYSHMYSVGDKRTLEAVVYPYNGGAFEFKWTPANSSILKMSNNGYVSDVEALTVGNTLFTLEFGRSGTEKTKLQFPITVSDLDNGSYIEPVLPPTPNNPPTGGNSDNGGSGGGSGCNAGLGSLFLLALAAFVPAVGKKLKK